MSKIKDKLESLWWYIEDGFWVAHDWFVDRATWQKALMIGGVVVVVLAIFVVVNAGMVSDEQQQLEPEQTTESIVQESSNLGLQGVSEESVDMAEALGYDANRANADIDYIKQMINRAFTFSDSDSYKYAREELLETYKVPQQSQFMTQVMVDGNSSSSNSLSVLSTDGYVTKVDGDVYEYTLETVIRVTTQTGNVADNRVVLVAKTDSEKHISDLRGYMADFSVVGDTDTEKDD